MTLFDPPSPFAGLCVCGDVSTLGVVHRLDGPCFHYEPPDTSKLGKFQKHSGTSRSAALDNYPRAGSQRLRVLALLLERPVTGATDDEIAIATHLPLNSVRPRRIELVQGGWVVCKLDEHGEGITRETRTGSEAQVWSASRMAREHARGLR